MAKAHNMKLMCPNFQFGNFYYYTENKLNLLELQKFEFDVCSFPRNKEILKLKFRYVLIKIIVIAFLEQGWSKANATSPKRYRYLVDHDERSRNDPRFDGSYRRRLYPYWNESALLQMKLFYTGWKNKVGEKFHAVL